MKCELVQYSLAADIDLPADEQLHAATCPSCRAFRADLDVLDARVPSLRTLQGPDLREPIRARLTRPQARRLPALDWRAFALPIAILGIVCVPTLLVVVKRMQHRSIEGEPLGPCPPFHSVAYGMNRMLEGEPLSGQTMDLWYSGHATRRRDKTSTETTLDQINWNDGRTCYRCFVWDGKFTKVVDTLAGQPTFTPQEEETIFRWNAPLPPLKGTVIKKETGKVIVVEGQSYTTEVTSYRLPVKPGPQFTSVEIPTIKLVYQDVDSGNIVRTEYVVTFPDHHVQTETHDFDYGPINDSLFNPENLTPTFSSPPSHGG